MSRIRYRKTSQPGLYESVRRYNHPSNGAKYKIMLNFIEHQWMILDDASGLVAASGLRVNQHKAKIDARAALDKLGIPLEIENRLKKT